MSPTSISNGSSTPIGVIAPPHNLEAEQSVLGSILLSDRSLYALVIEEGLRAEDFYRDRHGLVYQAMLDLYEASEPVDVLTVTDRLRQSGRLEEVGGRRPSTSSRASCRPPDTPAATPRSCARWRSCAGS